MVTETERYRVLVSFIPCVYDVAWFSLFKSVRWLIPFFYHIHYTTPSLLYTVVNEIAYTTDASALHSGIIMRELSCLISFDVSPSVFSFVTQREGKGVRSMTCLEIDEVELRLFCWNNGKPFLFIGRDSMLSLRSRRRMMSPVSGTADNITSRVQRNKPKNTKWRQMEKTNQKTNSWWFCLLDKLCSESFRVSNWCINYWHLFYLMTNHEKRVAVDFLFCYNN